MSRRRKSSNPCMVRAAGEERDRPEDVMDAEVSNDGTERDQSETSESAENPPEPRQEDPEAPDPPAKNREPEPSPAGQQSDSEDQIQNPEDSGGDKDDGDPESNQTAQKTQPRGYECKYCPFLTQNLNAFKEHVDSSHPNVILNPLYHCAACSFHTNKFDSLTEHNEDRHPGRTGFKFRRITVDNQTVLEQTVEDTDGSEDGGGSDERCDGKTGPVSPPSGPPTAAAPGLPPPLFRGCDLKSHLEGLVQKDQITAVNINGTVIIPDAAVLQDVSHVAPLLQRPPNFTAVPKIAVPLNTTKYNPSLDDNLTLMASFNKFPYPTHAELSWLTAASKHPEEQIKVWFTTQRLKQGITWSPEEVEEARKKMFNGSIPPAHHTFTVLPTGPQSQPSADAPAPPAVQHPAPVQNGGPAHALKRPLPPQLAGTFGPEAKRPVMAVAPHSGDAKDKVLMAPPPPPPPQKDRHSMAPPAAALEMKRPVAAPLVAAEAKRSSAAVPLPSPSPLSKGKILSALGSPKTKPVVSLPSIVFPESLTRPMIAPPPIFAPPFKNSLLLPRGGAKDKSPNGHSLDPNAPTSPIRRPPIIQSLHAPPKAPGQIPGFPFDGKKLQEQQGVELKASYPRGDKGVSPLSEANGASRFDSKWVHDQNSVSHNGVPHVDCMDAITALKPGFQHKSSSVLTQFPLLERMKGKSAKQLKVLEENFLRNSFPTHGDVDHLVVSTRLSHQEIESWFAERRALRDNLEQALLNSMGTKRGAGENPLQHPALQLNGIHRAGGRLSSPPPPLPPTPLPHTHPLPCAVPPDGRSPALLKDDFAWPEESGRTGLMRAELARWFSDGRLPGGGGAELTELLNGGRGPPGGSPENAPPRRRQDGAMGGSKVLEVELGWLMDQRGAGFGGQQHDELQERFAGRLRQQNVEELKNGGQNGGTVRDVFSSWLEDGTTRRGRSLVLDRDRKMDDASGRLTG
ncbi:zinc fingers and homeoboxes protein 2 [Salarias fasciatus]|uniref:Zinc fingers and homeoboxes protein 2-like n=1 Tax=Salarias fasciatus TaxID=181472 RepID=A0A672FL51_SALFA|nr:zinc fingers and homeoboxes protein 2-like [Salarias fasciatus]XP_029977023.1 zinc fingers and homeoboxes protein 2-like [Salarias fasciatus]XP_029977024.1 zinc fingers and homeoboxes protein 2-like [Salarias fasciatus]XP_029977025.1 zinc fingers and homeoboxes protein 2-like [Salarias fasciatus]